MKPALRISNALIALLLIACIAGAASGEGPRAWTLVATGELEGTALARTVVLAAPLPQGGHIGFIINRPTGATMETLFPADRAAHNVHDHLYLGGPYLANSVFAIARAAPDGADATIELMPGLFALINAPSVDRMMETTPDAARYFIGLMLWQPDELEQQIESGAWAVRPGDANAVFRADPAQLWKELGGRISPKSSGGDWI
jgi:putative transcriptional regulator